MLDSHPEIDKDRPGKRFVLKHFPEWDWYNTESAARTVADKAQEVIDELVKALSAAKEHLEYCGYGDSWERDCARDLPGLLDSTLEKHEEKKPPEDNYVNPIFLKDI